ncbi:MAG: glutamate--tRNA ligase, partial [Chitinophagaceae bacterium]
NWNMAEIETVFKNLATEKNIKAGELQLPMRVMLVGGKFGPAVMQIAEIIGMDETVKRVENGIKLLES